MSGSEHEDAARRVSPGEAFVAALADAARRFAAERGLATTAVRIAFHDGERVLVQRARSGPLPDWISLDVYPDDGDDEMIQPPGGGAALAPRVAVVHLRSVAKIDFLAEEPEQHRLGFWTSD